MASHEQRLEYGAAFCRNGAVNPLCSLLGDVGAAKASKAATVRLGFAMECIRVVGAKAPLQEVMKKGVPPVGAELMGMHLKKDTLVVFPIQADDEEEQVGMDAAMVQIKKCLKSGCTELRLDRDLYDYVQQEHHGVRPLESDEHGHLVGEGGSRLDAIVGSARHNELVWHVLVEVADDPSRTCEYTNVFVDVPLKVRD